MLDNVTLFDRLFDEYQNLNPSVKLIHQLFNSHNEVIINDHIAFRTFNYPLVNINALAKPFLERGYKEKGYYRFEQKKLTAKHFEIENNPSAPKIFISQLMVEELSEPVQKILDKHINESKAKIPQGDDILFAGNIWGIPSYQIYETLLEESEYAAWLYIFGFRANHFTVLVNKLEHIQSLKELNISLKDNGFKLNSSGGEIKGSPSEFLEQSSTLADMVQMEFKEGTFNVPACYYEFARRYKMPNGNLFNGFIAKSADKIFESTNFRK
ncbi:DUF1338 domain-containing protein [Carboxylicivirga caseinilyticus]|uniref:DUF1338 domain-containing protein n=1 Tax=Carboxylicivirga caseinilyticus TaxID=3417572 RepID=UPI003D326F14|nr:DUF1338 domain-containing protein [Marinilabiliaceae bacterium A049]